MCHVYVCESEYWKETWQLLDHSCSKLCGLSLSFYVLMLMTILVGLNLHLASSSLCEPHSMASYVLSLVPVSLNCTCIVPPAVSVCFEGTVHVSQLFQLHFAALLQYVNHQINQPPASSLFSFHLCFVHPFFSLDPSLPRHLSISIGSF